MSTEDIWSNEVQHTNINKLKLAGNTIHWITVVKNKIKIIL